MNNELVSVIIPTKNSSRTLDACLKSVKKQTYSNIELIVVDNNSSDNTKKIAKKYTKKIYNIGPERGAQRNHGAKVSKGKYLFFVDSDMRLSKDVVKNCVKLVKKNRDIGAVIIPEKSFGKGFWAQCKVLEKKCYVGDDDIEAARFFEKKVFEKAGSWDPDMIASEDWDLTNRLRKLTKIGRINDYILHDEGKINLIRTMKKKFYYGQKLNLYISKTKHKAKKQFTLFRPAFLKNWRLFLNDPIHGFGLIVIKIFEFGAGGLGYVLNLSKIIKCLW